MLTPNPHNIEQVPARNWKMWRDENEAVVIDVREPAEWTSGTLPGSLTIPLSELPEAASTMDTTVPILVVCAHGVRSVTAAAWLTSVGFEKAASMAGGITALAAAD